ncbi:ribosome maturation factor RimM [Aurantiacibacter spongiae]|uniref:Ribosome maturation factor RimM n=1 Tax=Aurantiacibacter spongiae TaxID=2488860 RepID=A0A3N5CNT1_9SPHN|nr:ribosome maturation factor RimM [Aurantiacibacter spongiae]RPF70604.1 16S rRNA processing protein RimM [Aurantiacibacter spongiae]
MTTTSSPIILAAITGAHGVTGEVRLKLFGDGIASLQAHRAFNGGALTLTKVRDDNKGGAIARFAEIADRNAAEGLRGTVLTVARATLPPLEEGEYYHADLIGLAVATEAGEQVGIVRDVVNYGAGDILEIERAGGKRFMVPFTPVAVPRWDADRAVLNADFFDED